MSDILIKTAESCVKDYMAGIKDAFPGLMVNIEDQFVILNEDRQNKVALVCGGGSGHEPFGAGFVGENMLTGYVSGYIFAAPPPKPITKALMKLARLNKGGILVMIMNYTGDVLNFGLAVETVRSAGVKIETFSIADDVSLLNIDEPSAVGRRGLCGSSLYFKILGAMSAKGHTLEAIHSEAKDISQRLATMGFGMVPCTMPKAKKPLRTLEQGFIEVGMGAHGESGAKLIKACSMEILVKNVLDKITSCSKIKANDQVVVLLNNMGSCTDIETYTFVHEVKTELGRRNIQAARIFVGRFLTCLDARGVQLALLKITGKDDWLDYIDEDTEAFGWRSTRLQRDTPERGLGDELDFKDVFTRKSSTTSVETPLLQLEQQLLKRCLRRACESIKAEEVKINDLDSGCGDGDCGSSLRRLADGIEQDLHKLPYHSLSDTFACLADIAGNRMGGTSGAIYSLLFLGAAQNAGTWPSAWQGAIDMVSKYSTAKVGDRTMMDALIPSCRKFKEKIAKPWLEALKEAVEQAKKGCDDTASMTPKVGRATYVDSKNITTVDAGAYGVTIWLSAVLQELTQ